MSETSQILEYVQSGKITSDRIDREKGLIRDVKFLGEFSANKPPFNHRYPRSTREAAIPLLEGARIYLNHPPRDKATETRPYEESLGVARRVHEKGDGLYGDFHFNPRSAIAEQICWDAENVPHGLGFSINGNSDHKHRDADGSMCVDAIDSLDSVDLVGKSATNRGLFESLQVPPMKLKLSALIESTKLKRPGYSRALREMADSGMMSPEQNMDDPGACGPDDPTLPDAPDHELALKQGFKGAMSAVLDDDSMDTKAKLAKLKEIMAAQEKLLGGDAGGKGADCAKGAKGAKGDDMADETAAEEARKRVQGNLVESLQKQIEAGNLKIQVRDLCADEKVTPTKILRKALDACTTLQEAKTLLEDHKTELKEALAKAAPAVVENTLLKPVPGAKSGFAPEAVPAKIQESKQNGTAATTPAVPKFEGDKAQENRLAYLRRN